MQKTNPDSMKYAILPETTLAAIVRDEIINPAGGVERFLRAALPHVEAAVVVDTGSIDGTCDVLASLKKEYSHLKVYHRKFDNFAPSRNFSLSKVKTRRVLVLDADELITQADYQILADFMKGNPVWGYWFTFRSIYPNGVQLKNIFDMLNPRLFDVGGVKYENGQAHGAFEDIDCSCHEGKDAFSPVEINHFRAPIEAEDKKYMNWYLKGGFLKIQPSEAAKTDGWKEFNHRRDFFE